MTGIDNIIIRKAEMKDVKALAEGFKKSYLPLFKAQNLSESTINEMFLLNNEKHLLERFKGNYFFLQKIPKIRRLQG